MSTFANLAQFLQPFGPGTFGNMFYQDNPTALYQQGLQQSGLGGSDARSRYFQDQQSRTYNQFLGQVPLHGPNYSYLDALPDLLGQIDRDFQGQSATQRGENPRAYSGRVRYIL